MIVQCGKTKNFFIRTFCLGAAILTIISFEKQWCNAANEKSYSFHYVINTGGILTHHTEERINNKVVGSFSFLQPDGHIRVVRYQVDDNSGFKAIVKYRKLTANLMGHLRYPKDFSHPVRLAVPVNLITRNLLDTTRKYPNLRT